MVFKGNGKPDRCSDSCGGLGGDELAGFGGEASGDTKALITTGAVSNREGLLGENGKTAHLALVVLVVVLAYIIIT